MRRYFFLLISLVILFALTLPTIWSGRFTFAFDMGRDMLWTRNMVELRKPTLVGPWGSIAGVYFGPLWYYLLAIPYLLTGGDPRGAVLVPFAANSMTMIIGWMFLKRNRHDSAADIWSLLYATSPLVISVSSFAFHANVLPLVTLLFIIGVSVKNFWGLPLSSLMVSFTYHLEPATGFMMTIFFAGWVIVKNLLLKDQRRLLITCFVFFLPFLPQGIFELRHDFIQSKALIAYFRGENTSLGGILPFEERVKERVTKLARTASHSFLPIEMDMYRWLLLVAFLLIVVFVRTDKQHDLFSQRIALFVLSFLVFHYLAYVFLFPAELKQWYLTGFVVVYLLPLALFIEHVMQNNALVRFVVPTALVVLTIRNTDLFNRFRQDNKPAALETLAAQERIVDWIYQDALQKKEPFSVYTYTPPIYDYAYQYLLWWRGLRMYNVLPAEFSYLPYETSYLPDKEKFVTTVWRAGDARIRYLILESDVMESRREGWLGHFAKYPLLLSKDFLSGVRVEIRSL